MGNPQSEIQNPKSRATVRVGHSPDPDDAFMFYALTFGKFDTAPEVYEHRLVDIETLNHAAERGQYDVTALSFHAYAYVADRYVLLPHGASFGVNYGPLLVARDAAPQDTAGAALHSFDAARTWLAGKTIAVPGERTSAFLALHLFVQGTDPVTSAGPVLKTVTVPFDQIIPRVAAGEFDAGLIIHEGQLTYHEAASGSLKKVVDLGEWWNALTLLPLPLGGNGIRKDLGPERIRRISRHLHDSIAWGLAHRDEALGYALQYARNMGRDKADRFVGMYVNDYALDYGTQGRAAVRLLLDVGYLVRLIPTLVQPEWSE
ncbi:MAG: ABC transporter substrate-binding protein [Planctomycetota bacterium]|nr:ABC transporter substrate-binding protein [Planctomycetota bacterium]